MATVDLTGFRCFSFGARRYFLFVSEQYVTERGEVICQNQRFLIFPIARETAGHCKRNELYLACAIDSAAACLFSKCLSDIMNFAFTVNVCRSLVGRFVAIMTPVIVLSLFHQRLPAQSLYLPQGNKHLPFLERLEIKLQKNPDLNIASARSVSRHSAVDIAGMEDSSSGNPHIKLSRVDQENLQSLLRNNAEWVTREVSRRGIMNSFYKNQANFAEINKERFFFALNPVAQLEQSVEKDYEAVYHYAVGANMRSMIGGGFGFYASATKHFESPPSFVRERIEAFNAIPGAGTHEKFRTNGFEYWDVRGGLTFKALKYFDFQVAYDRNFLGNGYRSLFLSDYAKNYVFGKATTRIWKFQYTHIYTPFIPQFEGERLQKYPVGKKMSAFHHLSINATRWLNLALFQSVSIVDRKDWLYMMPVIYYPVSDIRNTKPANNLAGFEFKANVAKRAQLYGQFLMDNFKLKEVTKKNGWWNNRFGVQAGMKYIDVLGIRNLDLQLELNAVRPYTYAADSLGSYTHYNQAIAHPLGANFMEGIGILRYQPHKRITTTLRLISWRQGADTAMVNFGSDIRKQPATRPAEFGYSIPTGVETKGMNLNFHISYELLENLFLDGSVLLRKLQFENNVMPARDVNVLTAGLRMNILRREYDY